MSEKAADIDGGQLPTQDGPILGHNRASSSGKQGPTISNMALPPEDGSEEEELDEFGLPVPKLVVNSRPASSRSDSSFESARSSIDGEDPDRARISAMSHDDDEDGADVEDNDAEEVVEEQTSPIEWPRLSRSSLPGSGHVKSSPFHAAPSKPTEKNTKYAERAKDLMKVSPVSNSIFKRKESPISPSTSTTALSSQIETTKTSPETPASTEPAEPQQELPTSATPTAETEHSKEVPLADTEQPSKPKTSTEIVSHPRHSSKNSAQTLTSATVIFEDPEDTAFNPSGASEWSHQMGVIQDKAHTSPKVTRKSIDNDGWQTMEAYAAYDMYDDDGRLIAKQFQESENEDEAKGGAGKGYTRMNQDEDAQSADSMDENTQYLFHESLDDADATTPLSQMQATKELLTEGQRIAYVGLCKLTMVMMLRDVGRVRYKENKAAYESMTLWSQKMMIRLFGHMDISPAGSPLACTVLIEQSKS